MKTTIRIKDALDDFQNNMNNLTSLISLMASGIGSEEISVMEKERALKAVHQLAGCLTESLAEIIEDMNSEL